MAFNYNKLLGKIKEVFKTQNDFAFAMGMGRVTLSLSLNNKRDFTQLEILRASELLGINDVEIPEYFFCLQSSEKRTIA